MPQTTAIIVTYNSESRVGEALAALQRAHESGLVECTVVDNASGDGTVALIQRDYPWVRLIASKVNLGYGRGLNLGMRNATTPYLMLMNPDAVVSTEALASLIEFIEQHPRAGMVAPAILEGEDLQAADGLLTTRRMMGQALGIGCRQRQRPIAPGGAPFQTDWVCGAVMLTRRELMEDMGGFDPRFFLYFEETDLCRRILKRGLELWTFGKAVAHHAGGASARTSGQKVRGGCISEHYYRSRFYYLAKHDGWLAAIAAELLEIAGLAVRCLPRLMAGKGSEPLTRRLSAPIFKMPSKVAE